MKCKLVLSSQWKLEQWLIHTRTHTVALRTEAGRKAARLTTADAELTSFTGNTVLSSHNDWHVSTALDFTSYPQTPSLALDPYNGLTPRVHCTPVPLQWAGARGTLIITQSSPKKQLQLGPVPDRAALPCEQSFSHVGPAVAVWKSAPRLDVKLDQLLDCLDDAQPGHECIVSWTNRSQSTHTTHRHCWHW